MGKILDFLFNRLTEEDVTKQCGCNGREKAMHLQGCKNISSVNNNLIVWALPWFPDTWVNIEEFNKGYIIVYAIDHYWNIVKSDFVKRFNMDYSKFPIWDNKNTGSVIQKDYDFSEDTETDSTVSIKKWWDC